MSTGQLLKNLGKLRSGYHYRSAKDLAEGDPYQAVQLSALTEDGRLDWSVLEPIRFEGSPDPYRIQSGDVLFPLRGSRTVAAVAIDPPADALAIGHWAILTPDPRQVDSTYLAWYWNHPAICKRRDYEMSKGSNIQFISMRDCRNFEVHLPSLQQQQHIARIENLRQQERILVQQIEALTDRLIDAATMQAVMEKSE